MKINAKDVALVLCVYIWRVCPYSTYYAKLTSPFKIWQRVVWECFRSILVNFQIAFWARYHTVNSLFTSYFFNRNPWNSEPILAFYIPSFNILPASSTTALQAGLINLSQCSDVNHSTIESRNHLSGDSFHWKPYAIGDYWLFDGDKRTGIIINTISRLPLPEVKHIRLKRPVFSIQFYCDIGTKRIINLVDMPTLKQAKELAEWYYNEWLKVNI